MKTYIPHQLRPLIFFVLIANVSGRAQTRRSRERYFTAGFNVGILGAATSQTSNLTGKSFERTMGFIGSDNGRKQGIIAANSTLGINAGFLWKDKNTKNYTEIQADLQRNRSTYIFNDPYQYTVTTYTPVQDNDADDAPTTTTTYAKWAENDVYYKYSLAVKRLWYRDDASLLGGDSYFYWKESFGQSFFHRDQNNPITPGTGETVTLNDSTYVNARTISYNPKSFVLGTELGLRTFSPKKDRSLDIGIVWYAPFNSTYKKEFNFYQKNSLVGSSQVAFGGSTILLNATYTFNSKLKERKIDQHKLDEEKIDILAKTHNENGRNFVVQQKVILTSDMVTARIWDRGTVDGDVITLYLNGEKILENFTTSKTKKEVVLHLKPGENYLVMYAVNLGTIPPNTATIEIEDGSKSKSITINSDEKKSGALEIFYKPSL